MPITTNVPKVVLNTLTQEQYNELQTQGQINNNELYGLTNYQETATNILYDNTQSGLNSQNAQSAVDELAETVSDHTAQNEYISTRLNRLESETHGDLALGTTTTVGGWSVRTLPSGEKVATIALDYSTNGDFVFDDQSIAYFQENIPSTIFTAVTNCEVKVIDISSGTTYKNSIIVATKELFGTTITDKVGVLPLEYAFGNHLYPLPTKLHAVWTVRGV